MTPEEYQTAERQVEAFIYLLTKRYGVKEEEIPELLHGLRWAIDHRRSLNQITLWAGVALVGLLVTGLAKAFWEGLTHFLKGT